jgi:hypothetical protein
MDEIARIILLIGLPFWLSRVLDEKWSVTAPDSSRKRARQWAAWAIAAAVVGAGFTSLQKPIVEQAAAELLMVAIFFPFGYAAGWLSTKL